jgi:hypothetical protein
MCCLYSQSIGNRENRSAHDLSPADQTPVLVHTTTESDLLTLHGAHRVDEEDLGEIALHRNHAATSRRGADVDHEHLTLDELGDTSLFPLVAVGLDAEEAAQQIEVDLELGEDVRQLARSTQNLPDQTILATKSRINMRSDSDQTTWNSILNSKSSREKVVERK